MLMSRVFFGLTLLFVTTLQAHAQTDRATDAAPPEVKSDAPPKATEVPATSDQGKTEQKKPQPALLQIPDKRGLLYADLMFLSAGYPTSGNVRLGLGSNIGKLVAVELSYMSGSQDVSAFGLSLGKIDQQIYGGSIRLYPTMKSLNVIGFYGQRWLTATLKRDDFLNGTQVDVRQKVAGLGIGNRWHLGGLQLGFDWLMYYTPVSKAKVSSKLAGYNLSDADRDNLQDGIEKVEDLPSVSFINLSIGFGFL